MGRINVALLIFYQAEWICRSREQENDKQSVKFEKNLGVKIGVGFKFKILENGLTAVVGHMKIIDLSLIYGKAYFAVKKWV